MSSIKTLVSLQTFIFDKMIKVKLNFSSESRRVYFLYYISISSPQASSISNSRSITGVGMRKLGDIWQYTIGESVRILLAEQSYLTERKSLCKDYVDRKRRGIKQRFSFVYVLPVFTNFQSAVLPRLPWAVYKQLDQLLWAQVDRN